MKMKLFTNVCGIAMSLVLVACVSSGGVGQKGDFDAVTAAKTRISLGLTYLKNGNYSQAKANLDKALEFAPRFADAHYSLAYYYQLVGENERASNAYQQALDLAPNNADIANTYGAFLCQRGQYQKAKGYFLKAVNSNNYASAAETYENLALCTQSQGKSDEAIDYLKSALKHQPTRAKSMWLLTELEADKGDWQAAQRSLKRYVQMASVSADTLIMAQRIEQALGNIDIANGYGQMLVKMYPEHAKAKAYLAQIKQSAKQQSAKTNSTIQTPAAARAKPLSTALDPVGGYHLVQRSENLYRISLRYNIKMAKLIEWNQLADASAIYPGMKLVLNDPSESE